MNNFLNDKTFLRQLDNEQIKEYSVKIIVLTRDEQPIKEVQGKVLPGSTLSIDGNSSVRRTCSLSVIVDEDSLSILDVNSLFSLNKKVQIFVGIKNDIDINYDNIVWFPMGIFIVNNFNASHSTTGTKLSLSCKDKMCLLNGDMAGTLPAAVTFDSYDQITNEGERVSVKQRFFDIIQTVVVNYGGEDISKVFVYDVPLRLKQLVRYVGSNAVFFNQENYYYTLDQNKVNQAENGDGSSWKSFSYNEDVGYEYTDFTYPGELVTGVGSTVTSVLDKIKENLGNYEYFYDVNGNFIFQEKKNYLNTSYNAANEAVFYHLDVNAKLEKATRDKVPATVYHTNNLNLIDKDNYFVDYNSNAKSVYTFEEGSKLIQNYSNTIQYTKIKNDFHVWGKNDKGQSVHYHLVIKRKPYLLKPRYVIFLKDEDNRYTGRIKLSEGRAWDAIGETQENTLFIEDSSEATFEDGVLAISNKDKAEQENKTLLLNNSEAVLYTPSDWRVELYLQGLEAQAEHRRPDIYQQELLDLFDGIYEFGHYDDDDKEKWVPEGRFKNDYVRKPNNLKYFFDYLEPTSDLEDFSVDVLGPRIYSYQQENITKLYETDTPDVVIIPKKDGIISQEIIEECNITGQVFSIVEDTITQYFNIGTVGYSASDTMRDLLYQYTTYNRSINISCIPIYYLEPNTRISVKDSLSNIQGDFIIGTITLPLDGRGLMSIQATQALNRV